MTKHKSLLECGRCGKDLKGKQQGHDYSKVIEHGYANILCRSCRMLLEDSLADVAHRFLGGIRRH